MNAMKEFDYYETIGIVLPGAILLLGGSFILGGIKAMFLLKDVTVGGFALLLLLAFAAGHVLQALGNGIEAIWWFLNGGMPSDWVRTGRHDFLGQKQREVIEARVQTTMCSAEFAFSTTKEADWHTITRRVYAVVKGASRADRIDIFNANYGLFRGLASALIMLPFLDMAVGAANFPRDALVIVAALLALLRMSRFGKNYSRELFVQFLQSGDPCVQAKASLNEGIPKS